MKPAQVPGTVAIAPGKVMLAGEYAVLAGAPALVMAVDRHARVALRGTAVDAGRIDAPQLALSGLEFQREGGALRFASRQAGARLGLTAGILEDLLGGLDSRTQGAEPLEIGIDTGELFHAGPARAPIKLGIGSSAAVSAALLRALEAHFGHGSALVPEAALARLLPAYRRAQHNLASGADLAASLSGGLIEYRCDGNGTAIRPVSWPQALGIEFVWTGAPAATADYAVRFEAWRRRDTAGARERLRELKGQVRRAVAAFEPYRPAELLGALADYARALKGLEEELGIRIFTPAHLHLERLATQTGVCYKTCGAGGGDLGIALSEEPERLEAFRNRAIAEGFQPLQLALEPAGARVVPGLFEGLE